MGGGGDFAGEGGSITGGGDFAGGGGSITGGGDFAGGGGSIAGGGFMAAELYEMVCVSGPYLGFGLGAAGPFPAAVHCSPFRQQCTAAEP